MGLIKEVTREMWDWASLERLGLGLHFGLQMLRKNPGFSLIAILALGVRVNTAIFSSANAILLQPLLIKAVDLIVDVWSLTPRDARLSTFSYPD